MVSGRSVNRSGALLGRWESARAANGRNQARTKTEAVGMILATFGRRVPSHRQDDATAIRPSMNFPIVFIIHGPAASTVRCFGKSRHWSARAWRRTWRPILKVEEAEMRHQAIEPSTL